jgi:Zn-dependent peptidase ImmA (M78 family)
MSTWADAHRRAAIQASELHADLDSPMDRPVDVFAAAARLGIVVAFAPLGKVAGLYLPRPGATPGILLHEGHPRTRQRYTAGHELGHHVFEHPAEVDVNPELALRRGGMDAWPDAEKEAEAFGAWFLMPRRLINHARNELGIDEPRSEFDVYALSLWLGTSYTATVRQLEATRLITAEQGRDWVKIPPSDIKRALAGEMAPDDLRNDVWWLDERQQPQIVDGRPGDRLVLTLREIPGSGISWRVDDQPHDLRLLADSYVDDFEPALPSFVPAPDGTLVGGPAPRTLVFELGDPDASPSVGRLALVKDAPWEAAPSGHYELLVGLQPRLHGALVSESELVLQGPELA